MERWLLLVLTACALAQIPMGGITVQPSGSTTPTLVQSFWTQDAGASTGSFGTANKFSSSYGEPSLAGNLLVCWLFAGSSGTTFTIADDQGETWTQATNFPFVSASSNTYNIWYKANNVGNVQRITITASVISSNLTLHCGEWYNVALTTPADGTSNCHTVTSTTATGVATGTLTSGDLVFFVSANDNASAIASFTAGSQTNITWALHAEDLFDGYAAQYGVYTTTTSFTPQMTTGTSQPFTSCQIQFKAASAGTAPTQAFRIVHLAHFAQPSTGTTQTIGFPSTGNLVILSWFGGGDCVANSGNTGCATTSSVGITSTPSNTWAATGTLGGSHALTATSQILYATNASTATTMTFAVTRNVNGGTLQHDSIVAYDMTGAASSAFDNDSGGQSGTQSSLVTTFTTCSACLSPTTSNGIVIVNGNWNFGTATAATAPSGGKFDSAWTNMNNVNGPQPLDENGGFLHFYNTSTAAITATWTLANDGTNPPQGWAGRAAHFLP